MKDLINIAVYALTALAEKHKANMTPSENANLEIIRENLNSLKAQLEYK